MNGKPLTELGGFRRDLLRAVELLEHANDEPPSGADLQRFLQDVYPDLQNGTLYPAIGGLVDTELVEKVAKDDRTNHHRLTDKGRARLEEHREYYCNNEH